jgi:hypothetical protein
VCFHGGLYSNQTGSAIIVDLQIDARIAEIDRPLHNAAEIAGHASRRLMLSQEETPRARRSQFLAVPE